jgi:uncharacterized protein (DUF362 family)
MNRVYIARLAGTEMTAADVAAALEWLGWEEWLPLQARIFIKPNLTWPTHIPGVTTTPRALEAVVAALSARTSRISVGESDGGYHSFRAEEAFEGHGVYALAKKYSIRVVNLSRERTEEIRDTVGGRPVNIILPCVLTQETDVFITLPVPKVHVMTGVSLAFKNQWGCNPSTMRLQEHPRFDQKIIAINRRLNPRVIMDGTYFLNGAGPLSGDAIRKNVIIAGTSAGAADIVCCEVMGIRPNTVRHLQLAGREGMLPESAKDLRLNQPPESFRDVMFYSRRAVLDWVSLLGFRSAFFGWLFWSSPFAKIFRSVLYTVRRQPLIGRLLYGKPGPPPDPASLSNRRNTPPR